ncbi:MAG: DUF3108 domain-containing protein [Granulosicoccus sp.]
MPITLFFSTESNTARARAIRQSRSRQLPDPRRTNRADQHRSDARLRFGATLFLALVVALLPCGRATAQAVNPSDITPFRVTYEVGNNLINAGTAELLLVKENDLWTYSLETEPRGILKLAGKGHIVEKSTIRLEQSGDTALLQSQTYTYRQDDERRRAVNASFNWSDKTIVHTYRGEEKTEDFSSPVIDRLSATLLIMNILRGDLDETVLQVFDTGKIKKVQFVNDGMETLSTPLGRLETIRVLNRNAEGGSRETTTWFAPSLDYVPVKIEHRKRSQLVARLTLKKLENRTGNIEVPPRPGKSD